MSSRLSNRTVNIAETPRNQNPFLKSNDLACPTCKKCIYSENHNKCILKYLSKVNSRTSTKKIDAQSHKTTKRYIPVEKKSESRNHGRQIPIGQRFTPNKSSNVYLKITTPRSGLTWKPTGKETQNPKTVICANSSSLSAEHPSDTKVFTVKMEILLEPTSNKLSVEAREFTFERLVPSCFLIFDLEPLSLSFDFFEHEHVVMNPTSAGMRHLHLHLYMNPKIKQLAIKRVDEYGFVIRPDLVRLTSRSSNTDVLDLPCLLVLITGTSQSRQHESHHRFFPVDTSLIHIELQVTPTKSLFDVGSSRNVHFIVKYISKHSDVLANHKIMRSTRVNNL
ncbi:hypothetical protein Tco_0624331 [Tanacetum coccineum]|uniref:Uncharacterized protein n=1 Tax=Tanacetum coccineum TaxID=301880 RepID=A0ABQ4WDR8_9ASTR